MRFAIIGCGNVGGLPAACYLEGVAYLNVPLNVPLNAATGRSDAAVVGPTSRIGQPFATWVSTAHERGQGDHS